MDLAEDDLPKDGRDIDAQRGVVLTRYEVEGRFVEVVGRNREGEDVTKGDGTNAGAIG